MMNMHDFTAGAAINQNGLRHIQKNILTDEALRRLVPSGTGTLG